MITLTEDRCSKHPTIFLPRDLGLGIDIGQMINFFNQEGLDIDVGQSGCTIIDQMMSA